MNPPGICNSTESAELRREPAVPRLDELCRGARVEARPLSERASDASLLRRLCSGPSAAGRWDAVELADEAGRGGSSCSAIDELRERETA
ncbi:hypothetical protein ASE08_03290 [Rhizobacter sp. Root16D2]|nr:hypothetical protein ASC88_21315 [Rhizobacter sp. Root29]KQW10866.1 hypothetical protein ASC98_02605 [Rhizobacter sp. Root1238]KRB25212.1 hypothetical protein ASE08_03290 [Rhizobacter sp. Root16D2]